jgi:glycosyltransferase involved in cell wall biosynthesis
VGNQILWNFHLRRSISIIIPAFNEEKRLPSTLEAVRRHLDGGGWEFSEIVVVDDGSTDGTVGVARAAGARVVEDPGNRGKGYAVRHGMLEAEGAWLLFSDADLSSPISELAKLWDRAAAGARVAIGSRALNRSLIGVHQPWYREVMGRMFNLAMRIATGLPFHDTQCGFKLFEAEAARQIFRRQKLDGFGFDVEALFIARRLGYQVAEVPVQWNDVAGTTVSLTRGMAAFVDLLRVRWNAIRGRYRA